MGSPQGPECYRTRTEAMIREWHLKHDRRFRKSLIDGDPGVVRPAGSHLANFLGRFFYRSYGTAFTRRKWSRCAPVGAS